MSETLRQHDFYVCAHGHSCESCFGRIELLRHMRLSAGMTGRLYLVAELLVSQDWASRDVGDSLGGSADADRPVDVLWVLDVH